MPAEVKTGLEGILKFKSGDKPASATAPTLAFGFVTGVNWDWKKNIKKVFNGKAFSHFKQGRGEGTLSVSRLYVDGTDISTLETAVTGSSVSYGYFELQVLDTDGTTVAEVWQFEKVPMDSVKFDQPEEDNSTLSMDFILPIKPVRETAANKKLT